jgi:hypothetical protein
MTGTFASKRNRNSVRRLNQSKVPPAAAIREALIGVLTYGAHQ